MSIKDIIEKRENDILQYKGMKSSETRGRSHKEEADHLRTEYMRDRDRIIHSEAFRRLKHKTQVFLSPANDSYRTRLTHTLEVSQIARTLSRAMFLNEDLTEAIALGHDVGHTPFGHTGEQFIRDQVFSEFTHSTQSVRVLEVLEKNFTGLNLTKEVLDGILKHSKTGKNKIMPQTQNEFPLTSEGEVVRISDIIAYVNHDVQDAVLSGILKEDDLPADVQTILGTKHSERINTLVLDVIEESQKQDHIVLSSEKLQMVEKLRDFLFDHVYRHPMVTQEMDKARNILGELYHFLIKNNQIIHELLKKGNYKPDADEKRALVDYLALMTDTEAMKLYFQNFIPKSFYWF